MPNWCEGTLKVRGTVEELKGFVTGALRSGSAGDAHLQLEEYNNDGYVGFEAHDKDDYFIKREFWLANTRRHFVMPTDICVAAKTEGQKTVLLLPFQAAWSIIPENLRNLCVEYHVDMKITGFEAGMQFQQEVEIVDGEIVRDDCIEYDDYEWECPCPLLGG